MTDGGCDLYARQGRCDNEVTHSVTWGCKCGIVKFTCDEHLERYRGWIKMLRELGFPQTCGKCYTNVDTKVARV